MKEGRYDRVLNKMMQRIEGVTDKLVGEFKSTKPFDTKPVSTKDRIYDYVQLTPQDIQFARQHFGNEVVDTYLQNMEKLLRRQKNA